MVIATSQSTAKRHVIGRELASMVAVAAPGIRVAEFVAAGGKIETAGVYPVPPGEDGGADKARALFGEGGEAGGAGAAGEAGEKGGAAPAGQKGGEDGGEG